MKYRQTAGSGRTAHRSDLEILEAIKLLRERNPGEAVTGYKLKTYFGEGHVNTYKSAIERLTLGGALDGDDEYDPALDLILQDAKQLVATIRKTASAGFSEQVDQLKTKQAQEMSTLQENIDRLTQANRELTLTLKQQESLSATQVERLNEMKGEIASLKEQLEDQRQRNQSLLLTNENLKNTVETLTGRNDHYERELTTMKELEAEAIQILKSGYERQLGGLRADIDRQTKELSVGREVRERISHEAARTLEGKKQLEREVHSLTLRLEDQDNLKQRLDGYQRLHGQLSAQLAESKAVANNWREALTVARTVGQCQVIYSDETALIIFDDQCSWKMVSEAEGALETLDTSQVISMPQGFLFPRSEVLLPRDEFTRLDPNDWKVVLAGEHNE